MKRKWWVCLGVCLVVLTAGVVWGQLKAVRDDAGDTAYQSIAGEGQLIEGTMDAYGRLWVNDASGVAALAMTKGIPLDEGTATAGTTTTLTDSTKKWTTNGLAGCMVRVLTGTGAGDLRAIASNTATALTVATMTAPVAGDTYAIYHPIIPIVVGSGTAGSAAGGVLTAQGVASMTPFLVTETGGTTPVAKTPTHLAAVIIGTPTTPLVLAADGTFFTVATLQAGRAAAANASLISITGSTSYATQRGIEMAPGDTRELRPPAGTKWDLNDWRIDGVNTDDGVRIEYIAP